MKPPARPVSPPPAPADPRDPALEANRAGVDGSVRHAVVRRLRTLVEKHPDQFVSGVRRLLARDD